MLCFPVTVRNVSRDSQQVTILSFSLWLGSPFCYCKHFFLLTSGKWPQWSCAYKRSALWTCPSFSPFQLPYLHRLCPNSSVKGSKGNNMRTITQEIVKTTTIKSRPAIDKWEVHKIKCTLSASYQNKTKTAANKFNEDHIAKQAH